MNNTDKQYKSLIKEILKKGHKKSDRTGTGTISLFDTNMKFDLSEGFPLLTSKKMFVSGIIHELLWFLGNHMKDEQYSKYGITNIKYLVDNNVYIWIGDAYKKYNNWKSSCSCSQCRNHVSFSKEEFIDKLKGSDFDFINKHGDLGKVYGYQWTKWNGRINQVQNLLNDLKSDPDSRRLLVSAWRPDELNEMTLPPCHLLWQCYTRELSEDERVSEWCSSHKKDISYGEDMTHEKLNMLNFPKRKISLKWTQRSVDSFLGLPYNIASYAILLYLIANELNMIPETLSFSGGDTHIYLNHVDQCKEQLDRETFSLPNIEINKKSIWDIKAEDIKIINYKSSPVLRGELSN